MQSLTFFQDKIKEAFANEIWLSQPEELYQPIQYTLDLGGKRIRPLLVLLANDLFGGEMETAIKPAIGVEIFHNFTLLHDDIMDQAALRRSKETVYKKWGVNNAILSGDTMFAMAYKYVAQVNSELLPEVLDLFTTTAREVCEGQQYDMNFETINEVSLEDYLLMIRLKTAVLLAASLKLGALIAHAPKADAEKLYAFGENLGMAFQIQDDFLDTFGNMEKFGKQIGGDILAGKKTFLVVKAMELIGLERMDSLVHLLNTNHKNPLEKVRQVKEVFEQVGADKAALMAIESYFSLALAEVIKVDVPEPNKKELISLAHSLLQRQQ